MAYPVSSDDPVVVLRGLAGLGGGGACGGDLLVVPIWVIVKMTPEICNCGVTWMLMALLPIGPDLVHLRSNSVIGDFYTLRPSNSNDTEDLSLAPG